MVGFANYEIDSFDSEIENQIAFRKKDPKRFQLVGWIFKTFEDLRRLVDRYPLLLFAKDQELFPSFI